VAGSALPWRGRFLLKFKFLFTASSLGIRHGIQASGQKRITSRITDRRPWLERPSHWKQPAFGW
jgi:hypothetical protein